MIGYLLLEDGTLLEGKSFGSPKTTCGEIVFNTGMTGYQEILTDPSYAGQVVTMTYPLIGNYGINDVDNESNKVQVSGFIVKELSEQPNHWQMTMKVSDYLIKHDIPGIAGLDTRMLTKKIRNNGAMKCLMTTEMINQAHYDLLEQHVFPKDIVAQVSVKEIATYEGTGVHVGLVDLGLKKGIIKQLLDIDCRVTVFPHHANEAMVAPYQLDVLMFSNGPGDPKEAVAAIELAKKMAGQLPMWGICLGHQVLALAFGADTYKLKFGHRGANHPVIELETNKVLMSSQNHGYAVVRDSLPEGMIESFVNVNDETNEGIKIPHLHVSSVQFHPEEGPGPMDAHYIFGKWLSQLERTGDIHA